MNFSEIAKDLGNKTIPVVEYILSLKISDAKKKKMLTDLFNNTGYPFYDKMFYDNSELFDSMAVGTTGFQNPNNQIERLSTKLVRNYNLSRIISSITREYYDSVLGDAQYEAFENALSLDKHPTLTRELRGETCEWCRVRTGTFIDPPGELFARHDNCDCVFITQGYNSRNGVLKNYTKKSKITYSDYSDTELNSMDRATEKLLSSSSVSNREVESLINYKKNSDPINNALYNKAIITKSIQDDIDNLDSLISKQVTEKDARVYKGMRATYIEEYLNSDEPFKLNGFMSTAAKKSIAEEFKDYYSSKFEKVYLVEIHIPKGTNALYIGNNANYGINSYNETELLTARGLYYKIKSIDGDNIVMEIIKNG